MNDRTACEIVRLSSDGVGNRSIGCQQAMIPDHVGHGRVIQGDPEGHENHPGADLDSLCQGSRDQGHANHGEGGLEGDVDRMRVSSVCGINRGEDPVLGCDRVLEQESGDGITEDTANILACEGNRPSPESPNNPGHGNGQRGHHHHVEYSLGSDHTP